MGRIGPNQWVSDQSTRSLLSRQLPSGDGSNLQQLFIFGQHLRHMSHRVALALALALFFFYEYDCECECICCSFHLNYPAADPLVTTWRWRHIGTVSYPTIHNRMLIDHFFQPHCFIPFWQWGNGGLLWFFNQVACEQILG